MTYTYARLEISEAAYNEIYEKLETAGYDRVSATGIIDMQGIGLAKDRQSEDRVHRKHIDVEIIAPSEERVLAMLQRKREAAGPSTPWAGYLKWRDNEHVAQAAE